MRTGMLVLAAMVLAFTALPSQAGEGGGKPAENPPTAENPGIEKPDGEGEKQGEEGAEPVPEEPKFDAAALFDKAVAWQGKPADELGQLIDLHIRQMDFKIWGQNEIEGSMELMYTAPKKVWFKVWTRAWWRKYWTNGEAYFYKTGAHDGCEVLEYKNEKDREHIDMIREALRIARLIILENHRSSDVKFTYIGDDRPRGKAGTPVCHLVKRAPKKGDDPLETMWFWIDPKDSTPRCIAVKQLLRTEGIFFVHLSEFAVFNGVKFPTHLEIYVEAERNRFEKFIFADVIIDADKGLKLKVNGGIDDEIFDFER